MQKGFTRRDPLGFSQGGVIWSTHEVTLPSVTPTTLVRVESSGPV